MKLFTKELLSKLPAIGSTSELSADQVKVPVKLFNPVGNWTWYLTEYNPDEKVAFGFVVGLENELGYISIQELEEFKGPFGLGIERDRFWDSNTTLKTVMDKHSR